MRWNSASIPAGARIRLFIPSNHSPSAISFTTKRRMSGSSMTNLPPELSTLVSSRAAVDWPNSWDGLTK